MEPAQNNSNVIASSKIEEPSESQKLKVRGRARTPPLKNRCIVYDCSERAVRVQSKAIVKKDIESYKKVHLPPGQDQVTIFVDPRTESEPTTEQSTDGHGNVMLTKLYLHRLGIWNQILRHLGGLSTLYVKNITAEVHDWSDVNDWSSTISESHSLYEKVV
ncbi:hypothetical protein MMC13_002380 [Lambiella insularis]|nr:hypothetical protein [Lambiella insularis]